MTTTAPSLLICCYLKPAFSTDIAPRISNGQPPPSNGNSAAPPTHNTLLCDGRQPSLSPADRALVQYALHLQGVDGTQTNRDSATGTRPKNLPPRQPQSQTTTRILVLSHGNQAVQPLLREALAMGADQALHSQTSLGPSPQQSPQQSQQPGIQTTQPLHGQSNLAWERGITVAHGLTTWLQTQANQPHHTLHLCAERSLESGSEAFAAGLAYGLDAAFAHRVCQLQWHSTAWQVQCKGERGYTQWIAMPPNLVCACSLQPQATSKPATLPQWLQAQQQPITRITSAHIPQNATNPTTQEHLRPPLPRVKRHPTPPNATQPLQRIRAMLQAETQQQGEIHTQGTPKQKARLLHQFLTNLP